MFLQSIRRLEPARPAQISSAVTVGTARAHATAAQLVAIPSRPLLLAAPRAASPWRLLARSQKQESAISAWKPKVAPTMPLLSTIGGTLPATLGKNGYKCKNCAHRVRLEHNSPSHLHADSDRTGSDRTGGSAFFPEPAAPSPSPNWTHLACAGAEGKYKTGSNTDTSCNTCDAGKYSKHIELFFFSIKYKVGARSCTNCAAGKYSGAGQSSCTNCAGGKSQQYTGRSSCTNCAAGKFQQSTGRKSCTDCDAGKFQQSTGRKDCTDCDAGKYSRTGSTSCTRCAAGKYSGAGRSSCTNCAAGKYSNPAKPGSTWLEKGRTECAPCASGKFQQYPGRILCLHCARGKWSTYNEKEGTSACTPCEGCAAGTTRGG
eukprot:scaffold12837_cov66-Phaeocystis_antarctica.AAC.3